MQYKFDFSVIWDSLPTLLNGCWLTIQISAISMVIALALALIAVLMRRSSFAPARWLVIGFVEVVRNTPFLVQIFLIFFGLPALGLRFDPNTAAIVALSLNGAAYCCEIIRGGVDAISKGQIEAGRALGLRSLQIFRLIILRPALRMIFPALTSQFTLLLLTSSIAASISAVELTQVAIQLESISFRSFEIYLTVTVLYFGLSTLFNRIFRVIEKIYFSYPQA